METASSFCSGFEAKSLQANREIYINKPEAIHSDEKLVERFVGGETDSFPMLVQRYEARIYSIVYGIMGSRDEAEDLSQEIFIKVYENLGHFKGKSKFYTWIYRITVNACLSAQRKKSRSKRIISMSRLSGVSSNPGEVALADETFSPQKVFRDRELASRIQSAINSLPGILRITFTLREFEDLSYRELARILRCSMGTVKSRLSRARESLRRALTPYLKQS